MSRVLVTGAGGFIGSHLVDDQLARGREVTALDLTLDRLDHLADEPRCRRVGGDVRDRATVEDAMAGVETVFHLASAHLEVGKPDSFFHEVNVAAIGGMLDVAGASGVKRFVHCSSVGVYGPLDSLPADEASPCQPDITYEKTKLAGEKVVAEYAGGVPTVVLRPAWVYGPRCPRTLKLLRTIRKKRFVMVGKGENFRHPIYISDMLQGFELAASHPDAVGETFIIASAQPCTLAELVSEIASVQELDYRPLRVPMAIMYPACFGVEHLATAVGKEPPFSRRSLKFFTESSAFDITKARKTLGFEPQVDLREGLTRTVRDAVERGVLG